ncbi:hypothetical protein ACIA8G_02840 [Lentzea sp. NPDC051213]|uniref:hypothetical protein n=1 Tax=Lentzea sp. NPDC051213 TaxID=3364126 RepID=UPI0037AC266B
MITSGLRGSIESRTGQSFPDAWAGMQTDLEGLCPAKKPCVGYALVADPTIESDQDCYIGKNGIKVPDPLYEDGKITFRVNNTRCPKG